MKILYISKIDVSDTIGPSVNERTFIPTLYKLIGEDAHFLIPKPCGNIPDDLPKAAVTFFKSSKKRKPHLWFFQQFSMVLKANRLIKEHNYDLIIMRAEIFSIAENYIVKRHKIPYALKTAGSGKFDVFKRKNILIRSLSGFNLNVFKKLVKNAFFVDVVSKAQRDSLREITGENEKIQWIDNGVDINRFVPMDKNSVKKELGLEDFNPIIGYAGNLPWERGAMQMVKALPLLIKKYPNIGVISLGSGEGMSQLYDKANELNVENNCVFTGQVPYEDVVKYINCMDIGISQLYEKSQGASEQKVRQYLACGKPVIVSPGSVNKFVEDYNLGYITDSYNEKEFYEAVDDLLSKDIKEYGNISINARKYALENLSYKSKVVDRLTQYRKIINR